jgi:hypothetical protein
MEQRSDEALDEALVEEMDAINAEIGQRQRQLFALIVRADKAKSWEEWGAQDLAHFLCIRYGISYWKASRWIDAAHALENLPLTSEALANGEISVDKVVELTRFATAETEEYLLEWARGVSAGRIRYKADLEIRRSKEEAAEVDRARLLHWWYFDEGRRFALYTELPSSQGAKLVRSIEREAASIPVIPGEEAPYDAPARRADALVAMASARIASDADPDRATVIIHARAEVLGEELLAQDALSSTQGGCEIEGGGVIHPQEALRLACSGRIQWITEDRGGNPTQVSTLSTEPSGWKLRELRYRDKECQFPGCHHTRFLVAHHIRWRRCGGQHELWNLIRICSFHHKLVHEYGWSLVRKADGVRWYRPDGKRYRAGPAPPPEPLLPHRYVSAAAI